MLISARVSFSKPLRRDENPVTSEYTARHKILKMVENQGTISRLLVSKSGKIRYANHSISSTMRNKFFQAQNGKS